MQALAARRFAESNEAEFLQSFAQLERGVDDFRKLDIRRRIEIENQASRHVGLERRAIPRMEFQCRNLTESYEAFDAVDFDVGFAVA